MRLALRLAIDKAFTAATAIAVIGLAGLLIAVLGPMVAGGAQAVIFTSTIEFRRMQLNLYNRGDHDQITRQIARASAARQKVYDLIDEFKQGIDTQYLADQVRRIHRQFGQELKERDITGPTYAELRAISAQIRDRLEHALHTDDQDIWRADLDYVLGFSSDSRLIGTAAEAYFRIARQLKQATNGLDLSMRSQYALALKELEDILQELLGPRPSSAAPPLLRQQYGATRWDQAQRLLHRLLYQTKWVEQGRGRPLVRMEVPRRQRFEGTCLEQLFDYVPNHIRDMLLPRLTFYWQFFIDDSLESHTFGGVGPEVLGSILITLMAMAVAVPLGIASAAYLAETRSTGLPIRIIRMCINTLAGVPSIVFGLFGLAFFVLTFLPALGLGARPSILAAGLTLAVLSMPVMIRSSEEAIKAVPSTYKEAALALGAGPLRTFLTVTFPAALPGILTGIILSLSRVAGETAPVLFTGAVAMGPIPKSILQPTRTLAYGSYDMAVGDRIAELSPHNQYGMVLTLVMLILSLNAMAIILRARASAKLRGH
ncbi:MAG: phosphate ABC transporter permease PstA [Sedimentisphaerales bacterium]|nr:phosphate ABC transporter permease PstA [Sedimentisphaerales bacterium]